MTTAQAGPQRSEDSQGAKASRAYGWKVSLTTVAWAVPLGGLVLTLWSFRYVENVNGRADLNVLARWLFDRMQPATVETARVLQTISHVLIALGIVLLPAFTLLRSAAHRYAVRRGEFSEYGKKCVALTRNSALAGIALIAAGVIVGWLTFYAVEHLAGALPALRFAPLVLGIAVGIVCLGIATVIEQPIIVGELSPFVTEEPSLPEPSRARATGQELLELLRRSPVFRRQIHCDFALDERKFGYSTKGRALLRNRFPRLDAVLRKIGIEVLSDSQTAAVDRILENERKGIQRDLVFIGRPGSGRSTMANLLALGVALQNEGAVQCVTAESPAQYGEGIEEGPSMLRHPSAQMNAWLRRAGLTSSVRVRTSYRDDGRSIDLTEVPHILYTDVRMLTRSVLTRVRGEAHQLLSRLRYVIIDQPDRLSREDLVRLRLSMCRLRMTAELLGTPITFIIILPRLNNAAEVAKYLVNRADVEETLFSSWMGRSNIVGWVPPLEIAESDDVKPHFVRASFTDEAVGLLTELGYHANQIELPLRIAVVDAKPLLGPEAREHIREQVRDAIAAQAPGSSFEVRVTWKYYVNTELGGEHDQEFDVIVSLGIGRHARDLVASLRPALAAEGAIILVADSSPDDIDSLAVISAPGWSPEREDQRRRFPTLLLPDHSDAVLVHELSAIFDDFSDRPLPRHRLLEVFPGDTVDDWIDGWREQGKVREVLTYESLRGAERWPRAIVCLKRSDPAFTSELFEVPWGCCSREVYRVFDRSANREHVAGPFLNDVVDRDRLFIDFHPQAVLRYAPNTLLVRQTREYGTTPKLPYRYHERGRLEVESLPLDDCKRIDRRVARIDAQLLSERPPRRGNAGVPDADDDQLLSRLRPAEPQDIAVLADRIVRRDLSGQARLRVAAGEWYCTVRETVRDVVRTNERLVEEPDFAFVVKTMADTGATLSRELESVALSLFFESRDANAPAGDYAGHHGLARAIDRYLKREFLRFDSEFRVTVIAAADDAQQAARILVYRLRSDELGWNHTLASVLEPEDLRQMFGWIFDLLEGCDCDDGCSRCCGGLGVAATNDVPRLGYGPRDVVSRKGAYELVCGILGRTPDWVRFRRTRVDRETGGAPLSATQLQRLVAEVIGTAEGNYRDGLWTQLVGNSMPFSKEFVAEAIWMDTDMINDEERWYSGLYSPSQNRVIVLPHHDLKYVKEILVHEYTHNWQFKSTVFDLHTHSERPEMKPYFDGKLIIEGHAVWCEQLYRAHLRLGASYTVTDKRPWNEYKVGYLLIEGIEKAIGQTGLLLWLCKGEKPRDVRSRDPRLCWPFTVDEALNALDLDRFVRSEPFSGFDVS